MAAADTGRRFLIAPRIRSRQADRAVEAELTRLGVDAVVPLNGSRVAARSRVTMRTRVIPAPLAALAVAD
jgi:hypothetical protein